MPAESPRIVVLDGYTLNPGDLSWEGLEALGRVTVYDRSAPEQVVERADGAEVVLTNKSLLSAEAIAALGNLKYIGVLATGYNVVDVAAAAARGISVTNIPTYGTRSVAQMVMAHVLSFAHHVSEHSQGVHEGRWTASGEWCYWDHPQTELAGQTMGIVGLGRIGVATARLADAFGMQVIAHTDQAPELPEFVRLTSLEEVLAESDVVSLHCPLTDQTQGLMNAVRLAQMKPTAILINTSRGPLVDEAALADALNSGRIAGAGLDVMIQEPPDASNPLLSARNCQITPHIAWASRAARGRLLQTAVDNVAAFLAGKPQNVVQ